MGQHLSARKSQDPKAQDHFTKCLVALHTLLDHTIPSLQNAIDLWHQKTTMTIQPCSNPTQCPAFKKPTTKNNSCPGCIAWVTAIEAQVYPPFAAGSLQWMNADSTLFSKDPLQVIKLFVLRMPVNQRQAYSKLDDFDAASLLMIMGKFSGFHNGDQAVYDNIQKVRGFYVIYIFSSLSVLFKEDYFTLPTPLNQCCNY